MKKKLNRSAFLAIAVLAVVSLGAGCQPAKSAAEADYTARQLACVDESATKDAATACRNKVKADWAAKQQAPATDALKGGGQ